MYGGSAYAYANDPEFTVVSSSEKFWQGIIDAFYDKYKGLAAWHTRIVQEVTTTGQLVMPTGRIYSFEPNRRGDWPITTIKNYPVQGCGADIMAIARVSFHNRFKAGGFTGVEVNTIHDSIVVDCPSNEVDAVVRLFHEVFRDLPTNFERIFKHKFDLPLRVEVGTGPDMKHIEEVKYVA
jgi:DNA polymerase-1